MALSPLLRPAFPLCALGVKFTPPAFVSHLPLSSPFTCAAKRAAGTTPPLFFLCSKGGSDAIEELFFLNPHTNHRAASLPSSPVQAVLLLLLHPPVGLEGRPPTPAAARECRSSLLSGRGGDCESLPPTSAQLEAASCRLSLSSLLRVSAAGRWRRVCRASVPQPPTWQLAHCSGGVPPPPSHTHTGYFGKMESCSSVCGEVAHHKRSRRSGHSHLFSVYGRHCRRHFGPRGFFSASPRVTTGWQLLRRSYIATTNAGCWSNH